MSKRCKRTGRGPFPPDGPPMIDVLFALNCETRLEIIQLLALGELRVSEIADRLELAMNTVSENLRVLWESGIVVIEVRANARVYRLSDQLQVRAQRATVTFRIQCREKAVVALRSRRLDRAIAPAVLGRFSSIAARNGATSSAACAR